MSNKYEDYDQWCDPANPKTIIYDDVTQAAKAIKPYILDIPCVKSNYGKSFVMNLYYKLEFLQKTGSFKERGAINVLQLLNLERKKIGICSGSIGNDAISLSYYASKFNISATVVMSHTTPLNKLQKLFDLGAQVMVQGNNLLETQRRARLIARERGLTFINGRDHPHILAGYGTVALEILQQVPLVEAILVPVGTGGLAAAVATVVKHLKPKCLIYGIQSESNPCFFKSLEDGEPLFTPTEASMADGITTPIIGYNSFHNAKSLLDKILIVKEEWIASAMRHLLEKERYIVEGAGAAPVAALIGHLVPELKTKTVVCILSGGNIDGIQLTRCLHRSLAADGKFVKFTVKLGNNYIARLKLLRLLSAGSWNVVDQIEDHAWVSSDACTYEIKLVCEAKNLEHALELKRILDKIYSNAVTYENKPFNDKRLCPCSVCK